jgi:thioredoxin 1
MKNNVFGNIEWSESTKDIVGLPRPFSKVLKIHRVKSNLSAKVPIPWQSRSVNDLSGFLRIIQENENEIYYKNLCSYCGIEIKNYEDVVRWKNNNLDLISFDGHFVLSDIHPLHLECMIQTRTYCPGMRKKLEEEFEYGKYQELNNNAYSDRKKVMDRIIKTSINVFYFTADWCQPCKKNKPIVKEINRDRLGLKFQIIDADIEKELVEKFNIKSLPTFIIISNEKEVSRLVGSQTKEDLEKFLYFASARI